MGEPQIPAIGEGKRGEDGYLSYLLRQATTAMRGAMDRRLAAHGLSFPQYTSLVMINAYPGLSSADLARITLLTTPTVNEVVRGLERAGLVERRGHATHRRILCLHLSGEGVVRLEAARRVTREIDGMLNEGLAEGEAALVRRWLTRVAVELVEG